MPDRPFADSALILLGHGSTKNDGSAVPVFQHAATLRGRGIFFEVREAFWKQEPRIGRVLGSIHAKRIFIVPIFISEGYFASQVIPQELGFPDGGGKIENAGRPRYYCRAIGTHETMTDVVLARARQVVADFPFPRAPKPGQTTLIIAGHGTERNENSRASIDRQIARLRARGEYAAVHGVFLDEQPGIAEGYALAQTRNVVVVPYFISDGMHTQEDIPVLLGEPESRIQQRLRDGQPAWRNPTEKKGKLVWYTSAVGTAPEVCEVILERVREALK